MTFRPQTNSAPYQATPEQLDAMSQAELAAYAAPALERLERGFFCRRPCLCQYVS